MQYAKIRGEFTRGIAFRDASMAARGAWTTLIGYCADQENGGRIGGCAAWSDRQWLSRADLLRSDAEHAVTGKLAHWDGSDLVVDGYDRDAEATYHSQRDANRARIKLRWAKVRAADAASAGSTAGTNRSPPAEVRPEVPPVGDSVPPVRNPGTGRSTSNGVARADAVGRIEPRAAAPPKGPASGGGGSTSTATTAPAAARAAPGRIDLVPLLESFGLHSGKAYLTQWAGLLHQQARCRNEDDCRRFLRLAVGTRKAQRQEARLPSHLAALVTDWLERWRDEGTP